MRQVNLKYPAIIIVLLMMAFQACSNDSNPAVPPAPEKDVVSIVERNPLIKIGLLSFSPQKHIYVSITRGTFICYKAGSLDSFGEGIGGSVFKFTGDEDEIQYLEDAESEDEPESTNMKEIRIETADGAVDGFIEVGTSINNLRPYRGTITLILEGKNILVINTLELEDYLTGVVPAEMNPLWEEDALKAQAVASRTYALFNLERYKNRGFDITDDERSQRYGGVDVETSRTDLAVIDTTYEVIAYNDSLACIAFHKESYLETADVVDVWPYTGGLPYLVEVDETLGNVDFSSGGNFPEWSNWASFDELHEALNRDGETFTGGFFSAMTVLGRSENGRIQTIDISGEKNPVVDAVTLMHVLNRNLRENFLPSNKFVMTLEGEGYRFTGNGAGHGVGMNQFGANRRASNGQDYKFILSQYYPGTEVMEIPLDGISVIHNTRIDQIH